DVAPWPAAPLRGLNYRLQARIASGNSPLEATGELVADLRNPAISRVGHMYLAGVDLLEGHVDRYVRDIDLPGRHLSLGARRTYSSAARGMRGLVGGGWSLSLAGGLVARPACGLFAVLTDDGGAQTFRSSDGGRTLRPQRGYHTTLRRAPDGSFDFEDKAGNRSHFAATPDDWGIHRLEYREEPHGDPVALRYDTEGHLVEISEVQAAG